MLPLFYLFCIAALVCLTYLQTSRSIYMRSLGLFLLLGIGLLYGAQRPEFPVALVAIMAVCVAVGFLSDLYSATLRTWYFRVSEQVIWGMIIGSMVGVFFLPMAPSLLIFFMGAWIGAMFGYFRSNRGFSFGQMLRTCTSSITGSFGMSLKLLMGMEMVYWFLFFSTSRPLG